MPRPLLVPHISFQLRDFDRRQVAPFSNHQAFERQAAQSCSHEFQHPAADRFEHPPHLSVPAFANGDFDECVFAGVADAIHFSRTRRAVLQLDAAPELI